MSEHKKYNSPQLFEALSLSLVKLLLFCSLLNDKKAHKLKQSSTGAGWSSLVARRAHNPKVVGSNPGSRNQFSFENNWFSKRTRSEKSTKVVGSLL